MKPTVLVVDDEPSALLGYSRYLSAAGYSVVEASCLADAKLRISAKRFDAVLLDLYLSDGNGIEWLPSLREEYPDVAIIVVSGGGDLAIAVKAMRLGADNYLTKPVNMGELEVFLRKSLEVGGLRRMNLTQKRLFPARRIHVGKSPAMKKVMELAAIASGDESTVLLCGETGTGKGVLSRLIHDQSKRKEAPFVEVNCSALRGELLASELFGHVKGAFTSAIESRHGLVEMADGGTLFLDEIGDMDVAVQAQMLKVIEEKSYRRLGETTSRESDFRLICATNCDLRGRISDGRFRNDLYFRINQFPIDIPPLRDRREDIPGFIHAVLDNHSYADVQVPPDVMEYLVGYGWPGNVRELKTVLERALLLAGGAPLRRGHFPGLNATDAEPPPGKDASEVLHEAERERLEHLVAQCGGSVSEAAKALGISRATLYRRLKKGGEFKQ